MLLSDRAARLLRAILAIVTGMLLGSTALAEEDEAKSLPRASVDGSIAWIFSDSLDLIGTMSADVPVLPGPHFTPYAHVDTRTAIERAISGLTFRVQSLDYRLEAGGRWPVGARDELSFFVAQRGRENVDREGEPWARIAGARFRAGSRTWPGTEFDYEWSLGGGPVLHDAEVDADFLLDGRASLGFPRRAFGKLRIDVRAEALGSGSSVRSDWSVGPSLESREGTSLYVRYLREESPLGIQASGVEAGIGFAGSAGSRAGAPPRVGGLVAGGIGDDGRNAGRLNLRFATLPILGPYWLAAEVDANVLGGDDTGELYYLYHVGFARRLGPFDAGAYYYHRSNHTLAEPNDTITSFDVLEAGAETAGFASPETRGGPLGCLEARIRLGYVLDTSFDSNRRWHLRTAVRLWLGQRIDVWPFVLFEQEAGDVERRTYAAGVSVGRQFEGRLEYRTDDAYLGNDSNALLFMTGLSF